MHRTLFLLLLLVPFSTAPTVAEVVDSGPYGFTSRNTAHIPASPIEVYAHLTGEVGRWWSDAHTFSGDAGNLWIDATPGGCFCESLPDGDGARHLTVVNAATGKLLRLTGGLGPLQAEGVTGSLSWVFEEVDGGTTLTLTYAVGGYVAGGLDAWAEAVDRVLGEQLERLARYAVTGDPDEPSGETDE